MPYVLHVTGEEDRTNGALKLTFANSGKSAAVFHVRSAAPGEDPRSYTVGPGKQLSDLWKTVGPYDLSVHGPNGFLHTFAGDLTGPANPTVAAVYDTQHGGIRLDITSHADAPDRLRITEAYTGKTTTRLLKPGETYTMADPQEHSHGWYDFTLESETLPRFRRRLAGHVETGRDSRTDPAIGSVSI